MSGIENNLYPPICSTYMPAFVRTSPCRVYFSLSIYNSPENIKNVQVVVNYQNTNLSALNQSSYPAGIKIASLQVDNEVQGDNKYFITINPTDIQGGAFELNQFYKVQLRFTGVGATNLTDNKRIAEWLVNNQKFFSEWSTVCLVKGIQKPEISLKGFEGITSGENVMVIFTSEVVDFIGQLYYSGEGSDEKEYLKFYNIKIYRMDNDNLVYDSGDVYTNVYNPNEINYTLKAALEDGASYKVILTYTTINEYTNNVTYFFNIVQNTIGSLSATITSTLEESLGRIKINISAIIAEAFFGNLIIRRTSSKTNFTVWEDIHKVTISDGEVLNYTWYDYTIESGVWYRYCAQQIDSKGYRGAVIRTRYPVMLVFDDMFLTRAGMQLKLRYNPSISSFKKTLLESRTDTLGSKYPIIRRNGNVGYRQFPISGLITAFCDEEGVFLNRENIYGDTVIYYDSYNEENNIDEYQDFIYEREFREKVMDFLHDNTVKLFRSATEGNILIKIMDVSFTPNQTLGRMLYSFSATAYEIDECSFENFNKYGIQYTGEFSDYLESIFYYIGQIQGTYAGARQDIFTELQKKYSNKFVDKFIGALQTIKWMRIEFNMAPYLIKTREDGVMIPLPNEEKPNEDTVLGYIMYVNKEPILVSPRGYYELMDPDTQINSIYFPVASDVTIDYKIRVYEEENKELLYSKIYFYTKVGQMSNTFNMYENVFLRIYQKYYLEYKAYKQELLSLNKVTIEAEPGTIAYIRDSFDETYFKHEIGPTGRLDFDDPEAIVTGLYFAGVQLYEVYPDQLETRDSEFRRVPGNFSSFISIEKPIKNGVYHIADKKYIYYKKDWYEFSDDNIVQCPVDALIDYIYEVAKGVY